MLSRLARYSRHNVIGSIYRYQSRLFSNSNNNDDLVLMEPWNECNNAITKITVNNPKKRNCLSLEMMNKLISKINLASAANNIQVIVINGNGPILSAGHDLKELLTASQNNDREKLEEIFATCSKLMLTIRQCSIPIITMTHGFAAAAGLQLAAASDMIISTKNCQFSTPGVNIGLFCSTPAIELSRCVGKKIAMEMLLTGDPINAERAFQIGLINHFIENDDLNELSKKTEEIAMRIVAKSKPVVALGKKGFYQQIDMDLKDAHKTAGQCMVDNLYIPDSKEGISSFIEKRNPEWTHKLN